MTLSTTLGRTGRALALTTAVVAAIGLTTAAKPAHALSPGEGVAIGLGALAVGSAIGASANPYYGYSGYGYGYAPSYYYPAAPAYYPPHHSCWSPYYGRYYPC